MGAQERATRLVALVPPVAPALPGVVMGVVVSHGPERGTIVDVPGSGPAVARLLVAVDEAALLRAAEAHTPVALLFEAGDPALPLIVGFVQAPQTGREVKVDGKRVVLTGEEEIELRCGEASISLKKNGRLEIRGAYVETRAKGTNRIKGGTVQIN